MQNPYEYRAGITADMTENDVLRLSALLSLHHAAANEQLVELGLDVDALLSHGYAFIISRLRSCVTRLPRVGETVTVRTWPRNTKGVQMFRCFSVLDENGALLVDSVATYALIDTATHTLQRPSVLDSIAAIPDLGVSGTCPDPDRRLPEGLGMPVGGCVVPPEWIDWNGHMNNVRYADVLQNFLPEKYAARPIVAFQLHFVRELLVGEMMLVCVAETEDGVSVQGLRGKDLCFEGVVTFG